MSRSLTLRPLARIDLRQIWDYTTKHWGQAKAEDYLLGLNQLFALLADHPEISREHKNFHPPVRIHPYQSHLIIFTSTDGMVEIIRVVHGRTNWNDLLSD